jgi:hypothetical protein
VLQALFVKVCFGEPSHPPSLAGFVNLTFARETSPPPFSIVLKVPCPFCYMSFSVPCLLFSFFPRVWVRLSRGLCWFIPSAAVGITCVMYLLTCWSVSPKNVMNWCLVAQQLSWFLHVRWHGEAICGMGAQGVRVVVLWVVFQARCVSSVSTRFLLTELTLSAS